MASSRRRQNLATFVLTVLLASTVNSLAQTASPSSMSSQDAASPAQAPDNMKHGPTPNEKNARISPADARKAQILEDTNRLYRMAEELKAEVAKSNKDILSVAVVKKADEIEKLAKSLKERMRSE